MTTANTTLTKKTLRRVKLGKLEGSTVAGDCPEGYVFLDGYDIGTWTSESQDEGVSSHRYRVYGYEATVEIGGEDVAFEVVRTGCTRRTGKRADWSRPYVFGSDLETAASAKARLRRMIVEAIVAHEAKLDAEATKRELERQVGIPQGSLDTPAKIAGTEMVHHPRSAFGDLWSAEGGTVEFAPSDVERWARFRTYGIRGDRTAAILTDGRRIQVAVSKLPTEAKRFVTKMTAGLGTGRMSAQRNGQAWSVGEALHRAPVKLPEPTPVPVLAIQRALVDRIKSDVSNETLCRNRRSGDYVVAHLEADGGDRLTFHVVEGDTVTRVTVTVTVNAERI